MPLRLDRSFRTSKVPSIDATFWILKLLTTAMGEATSDFFVRRFNPEVVVVLAGIIFIVAIWRQLRAPRYFITTYWSAVVMVSVFGTMCADVLHVRFGVPYVVSATSFAVVLAVVFVAWARSEHTLSIHSITTTRRELFYWAAILVTFALGTAVGDMTAVTLHLGFLASGIVFTCLFAIPGLSFRYYGANAIAMFWTAYILTRPVGASFADYIGVSHIRGGLNFGSGYVAMILTFFIATILFVLVSKDQRQVISRARHAG